MTAGKHHSGDAPSECYDLGLSAFERDAVRTGAGCGVFPCSCLGGGTTSKASFPLGEAARTRRWWFGLEWNHNARQLV